MINQYPNVLNVNEVVEALAKSGISRPVWQSLNEALSIAIPIMIRYSHSPSNTSDLIALSKVLNRGEIGMSYDNVAEFINAIRDELSGQIELQDPKDAWMTKLSEIWLEQSDSTRNRNRRVHPSK
jgi:hypothetical protein